MSSVAICRNPAVITFQVAAITCLLQLLQLQNQPESCLAYASYTQELKENTNMEHAFYFLQGEPAHPVCKLQIFAK